MIYKINNFSLKSFKNYTTPNNMLFKKNNVFFGYNGKGKTSLAKGIEKEIRDIQGINDNEFRIFSKDYLKLKLVNDKRRIKGVKAVFGNKNVKNDEEIEKLKEKIQDTTVLSNEIISNLKSIDSLIKTIEDGIRGSKKIRHVSVTNHEELANFKATFQNMKATALKITTVDKLETINVEFDFERAKLDLESLPTIDLLNLTDDLNTASKIVNSPYKMEDIPATKVLDWIEQGILLNKEREKCLFCGSELTNYDKIVENFKEFVNSTKQKDERLLINFFEVLKSEILKIENFISHEQRFENCGINISSQIKALAEYKDRLCYFKERIDDKLSNFESLIPIEFGNIEIKRTIASGALFAIKHIVSDSITRLTKEESKFNDLLKGSIAIKILSNKKINELAKETNEKIVKLKAIDESNLLLNSQIRDLRNKVKATNDFAIFINGVLLDLDFKFKLDIIEEDYRITPLKSDTEIDIDEISEGERNLLSLLFFYFELFDDDKQIHFKEDIRYVIVDDPLSSLDDNNRAYLISVIQLLFKQNNVQVFVFTHDWDAYCQLLYNADKNNFGSFEIKKDSNGVSNVEIGKPTITPYEHDFFELLDMSNKTADSLDDCDIYHLPNCMRRVLESFLKFKVPNSSPTNKNVANVSIGLFNKDTLEAKEQTKLMALLLVINSQSHKAARNSEEVFKALKFLISRIKVVDEAHFNMLKNKKSLYDQINGTNYSTHN